MKILQVPDGAETSVLIENILKELLAPVAEVELLKRKQFLTGQEVEKLYGIPEGTLRVKRKTGGGPAYYQKAKCDPVRYAHEDIQEYYRKTKRRVGGNT